MSYKGHKNWTQWNVSLWINNDEGLYTMARYWVNRCSHRHDAACGFLNELSDSGITETPHGAKYSVTSIRAAMVGMERGMK